MKYQYHRCSECNRLFIPDPRVGDRQVTCGAKACQQSRHAAKCKIWHQGNHDASVHHYEDVVKPFRAKHPTYQRRWRLVARLREIREQIIAVVVAAGQRLRDVLHRGSRVVAETVGEPPQGPSITGESLRSALAVAQKLVTILDTLARVAGQLSTLGGRQ